jgi:uncharacterized membrane protein YqjE
MAGTPAAEPQGLRASLGQLATSALAIAQTRLELLSLDLAEGRQRLLFMLLAGLGAMLGIGIGSVLAVLTLLLAIDEPHRLPLLAGLAGASLLAGVFACAWVIHRTRSAPSLFAASLAELDRDRQQLRSRP